SAFQHLRQTELPQRGQDSRELPSILRQIWQRAERLRKRQAITAPPTAAPSTTAQTSIIPESTRPELVRPPGGESHDNRIYLLNIPPEAIPIPAASKGR